MNAILVLVGGGFGALSRYAISTLLVQKLGGGFAWGTAVVNIAGCFLIGFAAGFTERLLMPRSLWLLLVTGFLGGFTTFSTFSMETVMAFQGGMPAKALLNTAVNLLGGVGATILGMYLALSARSR